MGDETGLAGESGGGGVNAVSIAVADQASTTLAMSDFDLIMEAISSGDLEALDEFHAIIGDFPSGKDDLVGRNWLTNAIDAGTRESIEWMLERGAPVIFEDAEGYSVLHSAIHRRQDDRYEILRLLVAAGANLNARGVNDWTPAHFAAVRNDVEALTILREAGADFTLKTRIDLYATPLEEARALGRSPDAVRWLEQYG